MAELVRKKILVVRTGLGQGGADRVTLNILQALDVEKYDITLFLMKMEGQLLKEVPSYVRIISGNSRNLFFFIVPLIRIMQEMKPDISFSSSGGPSVSLAIAHFFTNSKSKLVLSERGRLLRTSKSINRILRLPLKLVFFRRADAIIVVSKAVQTDLKKLSIPAAKIKLLDNPVIPENYLELSSEAVNHRWLNSDVAVIMHAGRFVPEKDHTTLIRTFEILQKEMDVRLMLFGEGELKPEMERLVKVLGVNEKVEFMGFEPNLYKYLKHASVFVLSSISEGMPGVLIQAMALGIPCVSSDCPTGPSEVIRPEWRNGLLVPMKNTRALADGIKKLLTDKVLYNTIKLNSAKSVSRFLPHNSIDQYVQYF